MKKRLRDKLPYGLRKLSRRLIVRLVAAVVHVTRDNENNARGGGEEVGHEWKAKGGWEWEVDNDLVVSGGGIWSVQEFLFLMDLLMGRHKELVSSHNQIHQ